MFVGGYDGLVRRYSQLNLIFSYTTLTQTKIYHFDVKDEICTCKIIADLVLGFFEGCVVAGLMKN